MYSAARRHERRPDVIDELRKHYRITDVIDYSAAEEGGVYLEGTGSLVLDHENKIAYASLSQRTHRGDPAKILSRLRLRAGHVSERER